MNFHEVRFPANLSFGSVGGPERRSRLISPTDKKVLAYHEAGHAVIAHLCEYADPIQKGCHP